MAFRTFILIIVSLCLGAAPASARSRYFHSGDGILNLSSEKNGKTFVGRYRNPDGSYRPDAIAAIGAVFGAPHDPSRQVLSLRLIEYLDFLSDRLNPGARLRITSGYRAPKYNADLRRRGALAAKASLHQYGMAADVVLEGVSAKRVWEAVRKIGFGGAGYYHGRTVHVDVGPARFWDEKTSGVGSGLSDDNKLIGLVTDYDVYLPGEPIVLRFIRMTSFPIGVGSELRLVHDGLTTDGGQAGIPFRLPVRTAVAGGCPQFHDIDQMAGLRWQLPASIPPGRYRIRAAFCGDRPERMPAAALTPPFEIKPP